MWNQYQWLDTFVTDEGMSSDSMNDCLHHGQTISMLQDFVG